MKFLLASLVALCSINAGFAIEAQPKTSGFLLNDEKAAFKTAKEEDKLIMIDFFGIWCPPCNQLDEHVFSSPEFAKKTERFVKLKLDADADVSWELKSKFKIQGYPTVVFATADGDEVGRLVGYRPLPGFLKSVSEAWANRTKSFARLKTAAEGGDKAAAAKIGLIEFERGDFAAAKAHLTAADAKKYGEKIAISEIGMLDVRAEAGPKAPKTELVAALEKSIRDFPNSPESVDRRITLAGKYADGGDKAKQAAMLKDAVRVAKDLIAHPARLEGMDSTPPDLWSSVAGAEETLGDSSAAKAAWLSAVKEYRAMMKSEDERGYSLELAYCLWKSGDVVGADAIYRKFETLYPKEFTFYHAHSNMNFELKKYPEAESLEAKAYEYSYGDNKLRAGYNLARALKAEGKKKEAIAAAERTLSEVKMPADSTLRTHRSADRLKKMIAELGS
jgi:tetratricopeptide (TPR) repeat protein